MIECVCVISVETRDFHVFTHVASLCSTLCYLKLGLDITLQTCIPEVLSSNLGRDTGYPDRGFFSIFLSSSRQISV
jgi:hypothetical protein